MKKFILNKTNFFILLISLITAITILGVDFFLITNTQWIHAISSDIAGQHSGWIFFKNDIWRFPLGSNPNFGDEFGNSIIFSDSIPILAFFFKFISPMMPEKFQYHSIWYFICFFMQLYFSHKIIYKFTKNNSYSLIGSLFFLIAPIFVFRIGMHSALAGQWILLLTLNLVLTKKYEESKLIWIFVLSLSSLIHFYFTIIISIVFVTFKFFNFFIYKEKFFHFTKDFFITFAFLFLVMYIAGYFEIRTVDAFGLGYGALKLNLLSIFDPVIASKDLAWSWILPDIKLPPSEDMEGFNYLGLGQIVMILVSLYLLLKNKKDRNFFNFDNNKEIKIFIWISLLLTLIALSNKISLGSYTLIEIPLNKFIYALLSFMRASGRLFWIVYYFLILMSLLIIFKSFETKKSFLIIITLLILQIADTSAGLKDYIKLNAFTKNLHILKDPIWKEITKNNKIIKTTFPIYYNHKFGLFSYFYEEHSIEKTNIIITARANRKLVFESRNNLYQKFNNKELESNIIYFIDNQGHLRNLKQIFKNDNVGFFYRDKIWIMLKNKKNLMNNTDLTNFKKIEPQLLKINEKKDMHFSNSNYYGFGWSHNFSGSGIWSEGNLATLLFSIEPNSINKTLEIYCIPYLTNKNKNLDIDIYVNNQFAQNLKLKRSNNFKDKKIQILLDNKFIEDNKEIKIDFNIKNPISPMEILESPDSRKLGILLKSIELKLI